MYCQLNVTTVCVHKGNLTLVGSGKSVRCQFIWMFNWGFVIGSFLLSTTKLPLVVPFSKMLTKYNTMLKVIWVDVIYTQVIYPQSMVKVKVHIGKSHRRSVKCFSNQEDVSSITYGLCSYQQTRVLCLLNVLPQG